MRKLTLGYIKSQFEKEGYTLLSREYKNSKQKLEYICSNGHHHSTTWFNWQQNNRCPYCSGLVRKTIEEIRKSFESEGYTLLTEEYKNNKQKLEYICPKGHKHSISWINWQQGHRCSYCSNNIKKTIRKIRKEFEKEGYILLTKRYKNQYQKLHFICPNGHQHSIRWNDWQQGHRCSYCMYGIRKSINEIKIEFEKEGYTLLSREYKNSKQKLEYICPQGHRGSIKWNNFQQGQRCLDCYLVNRTKYYSQEDLEKYNTYRVAIDNLTNRNYKKYKSYINPKNLKRGKCHHLDHIYSVIDGFENNISIDIISNPNNLRIIPSKENLSKNGNSYISRMLLYHLAI